MFKKKNKIFKVVFFVFVLLAVFSAVSFVYAADTNDVTGISYGAGTGLGAEHPILIIAKVVRVALGFLGIIAVSIIMYAGWLWMNSDGEPDKIKKAMDIIKNAAIGILIIFSSFAIVTFFLNSYNGSSTSGGGGTGSNNADYGGLAALGNGIIESVYPEPGQKKVPRNTSIIVTFREAIDPNTICSIVNTGTGKCDNNAKIKDNNVRIFKSNEMQGCTSEKSFNPSIDCPSLVASSSVSVSSGDNKIFIFSPDGYLGSESENLWQAVYLSKELKKKDGGLAFKSSPFSFRWQFEVSNKLDLDPPQVLNGGVFPGPDNMADIMGDIATATQAMATITVKSIPDTFQKAKISKVTKINPSFPEANLTLSSVNENCDVGGSIKISVNPNGNVATATKSNVDVGSGIVKQPEGDEIGFNFCGLKIKFQNKISAGNAWTVSLSPVKEAGTLTIGDITYTFATTSNPDFNQISTTTTNDFIAQAGNIATIINNTHPDVVASHLSGSDKVVIKAKIAGKAGNDIVINTTVVNALNLTSMDGGKDREVIVEKRDKLDKPRNAIIQINFNEAIDPSRLSGSSSVVSSTIKVMNISDPNNPTIVNGKFVVAPGYRTVEFISDNLCGVNSCGEKVYCLPENSHLEVQLFAAALQNCINDNNCKNRGEFKTCSTTPVSVCQKKLVGSSINYPQASTTAKFGIIDLAKNSLDGDRDNNAEGPLQDFNENQTITPNNGDNFKWSFYISNKIDMVAPEIVLTKADNNDMGVNLDDPVKIQFSKLMMSNSLTSGEIAVVTDNPNGTKKTTIHKLINIWSKSNRPMGYWVTSMGEDNALPKDGEPDITFAYVNHERFYDSSAYRTQVGSGVKDIYQNCFTPCAGPACITGAPPSQTCDANKPSCCGGTASAAKTNCP